MVNLGIKIRVLIISIIAFLITIIIMSYSNPFVWPKLIWVIVIFLAWNFISIILSLIQGKELFQEERKIIKKIISFFNTK